MALRAYSRTKAPGFGSSGEPPRCSRPQWKGWTRRLSSVVQRRCSDRGGFCLKQSMTKSDKFQVSIHIRRRKEKGKRKTEKPNAEREAGEPRTPPPPLRGS